MKSLIGSFEDPATHDSGRSRRLAIGQLLAIGLPFTALLAFVDHHALQACASRDEGWQIYTTYTLFVVQTAALAALVGSQLRREQLWWLVLIWGVLLVDLQVFALAGPAGTASQIKKLGFAIASAQIGTLTCFGVLGGSSLVIRLPIAGFGLTIAMFFAGALGGKDTWYMLLLLQCIATAIVCVGLRWFSFRIMHQDLGGKGARSNPLQFSIRHLFYWTTGVAVSVAIGRFVGWKALLGAGLQLGDMPQLLVFVPLLTLTSVIAMWSALGRELWSVRLPVLLLSLPVAGLIIGICTTPTQRRYDALFYDWNTSREEAIALGIVWSVLAGTLLAGLLLLFRMNSQRLQRRA